MSQDFRQLREEIEQIFETKPRRAWNGKIKRIDAFMAWLYDKDILTKSEKNKKDSLFHKYYRWYNDGDFPRGMKTVSANFYYKDKYGNKKYPQEAQIEKELEQQLDTFIKQILSKYLPKVNRNEFYKDEAIKAFDRVLEIVEEKDADGLKYWVTELPASAQEQIDISELKDLLIEYEELIKDLDDPDYGGKLARKRYSYARKHTIAKSPEIDAVMAKIEKKLVDIEILVRNLKKATEEFYDLKLGEKE